jgi:hypothetical protein
MVQTRSGRDSLGSEGEVHHAMSDKGNVFHKGVAISMWQNSGDEDSNWTNFIKSNFPFKALPFGFHRYSGKYSVMENCPDTWNRLASSANSINNNTHLQKNAMQQ